MKHKRGSFTLFFLKGIFILALVGVFYLGQRFFYEETLYYFWGNILLSVLYTAILYLSNRIYDGFDYSTASVQELIVSWILCLIIVNVFQFFVLSLIIGMSLNVNTLLPVHGFAVIFAVQIVIAVIMTVIINLIYNRLNPAQATLIIYGDAEKLRIYRKMIERQAKEFKVIDAISQDEPTGAVLDMINNSQSVFFLGVDEKRQDVLLEYCYINDKHAFLLPTFSRVLVHTAGTVWLANTPVFSLTKPEPDTGTRVVKRIIDILGSLTAIIITSPFMAIIAIAVRLHDNNPVIYKQVRVTQGGRRFNMYKFRSMIVDAEDDGIPRLTAINDPRITPVGRFIRKTRMDELPQLFNVLFGAMSLVGPRPERPEIAEMYEEVYPNFAFRTKVKAGITGLAQIYGRYNTAPDDKLFLDIMYIETFSILQDVKLILQTISVLFKPMSTEGIENDTTTALR